MFDRNYMEYHSDRFTDHSLMFFSDDELVALLPANEDATQIISHGGLTYGGFITGDTMKQHAMLECFSALIDYMKSEGLSSIVYKLIPHIYHRQPAEEDRYALFVNNAVLLKTEPSTVVDLGDPLKMPKGRKAQISRARREKVSVEEMTSFDDYRSFIELENMILSQRHETTAVHTPDEIFMLHTRFPENIRLFAALYEGKMIAGTVIFEYDDVIHTQYMAADETARRIGALDLCISSVMERYATCKKWLDFGISTEKAGRYLNDGLISQKESFGGRTNVYQTWRIDI